MTDRQFHAVDRDEPGKVFSFDTKDERNRWVRLSLASRSPRTCTQLHHEGYVIERGEVEVDPRARWIGRVAELHGMTAADLEDAFEVVACECRHSVCRGWRLERRVRAMAETAS